MRQKAYSEQELQDRLAYLSGKGIASPKSDRDPIVRKLKADIKAANKRLRMIAENEKRTEEATAIKAEKAAAPKKEKAGGKGESAKKAAEEGKGKKAKGEKKAAPPKAPEGGKSGKSTDSPEEGRAAMKKKGEPGETPANPEKAEKDPVRSRRDSEAPTDR